MADDPTAVPALTMTPELERIRARGRYIHPTFPDNLEMKVSEFGGEQLAYNEDMNLPALDDKKGILRYVGLNDDMIDWALQKYQEEYSSDPEELAVRFRRVNGDVAFEGYDFPLLSRFNKILMKRDIEDLEYLDINYDDYVRGGLAEGLRPEFAIFCGLHESEPEYADEGHRDIFYAKTYQEHVDDIIGAWLASLSLLWRQKLQLEDANRRELEPAFESLETQTELGIKGDDAGAEKAT